MSRTLPLVRTDGGRGCWPGQAEQARDRGRTSRDCVCRAIAIATEMPYWEVHEGLLAQRESMRQTRRVRVSSPDSGVNRVVYERYLAALGWEWVPVMGIGTGCTMRLAVGEVPAGRIIVRLSRHLAAVIDGVLHDSHDCSRGGTRCVYGYWKKGESK